jgi:hypothetical protein
MSDTEALAKLIAEHLQRLTLNQSIATPQATPIAQDSGAFNMLPTTPQQAPAAGPMPRLVEVSVPVVVQLPDGREVTVRLHFSVEGVPSLQHIVNYCAMLYGPALASRRSWGSFNYGSSYKRRT